MLGRVRPPRKSFNPQELRRTVCGGKDVIHGRLSVVHLQQVLNETRGPLVLGATPRFLVFCGLFLCTLGGLREAGAGSSPTRPLLSAGGVLDRAGRGLFSASHEGCMATDAPRGVALVF